MAYTFTRTGAQIEEIHNTVEDPKSNTQFSDDIRTIAGEYRGLWPDTGGSANKGDTYQTQVGGTPTGQYFTALQNTTVDPVGDDVNWREVLTTTGDGSQLSVLATGGDTPRTLGDRFSDVVNIKDFGAVGDGVNDDTSAIQLAIETAIKEDLSVYIPPGHYKCTDRISVTSSLYVYGDGEGSLLDFSDIINTDFVALYPDAPALFAIRSDDNINWPDNTKLEGFKVKGCITDAQLSELVGDGDLTIPNSGVRNFGSFGAEGVQYINLYSENAEYVSYYMESGINRSLNVDVVGGLLEGCKIQGCTSINSFHNAYNFNGNFSLAILSDCFASRAGAHFLESSAFGLTATGNTCEGIRGNVFLVGGRLKPTPQAVAFNSDITIVGNVAELCGFNRDGNPRYFVNASQGVQSLTVTGNTANRLGRGGFVYYNGSQITGTQYSGSSKNVVISNNTFMNAGWNDTVTNNYGFEIVSAIHARIFGNIVARQDPRANVRQSCRIEGNCHDLQIYDNTFYGANQSTSPLDIFDNSSAAGSITHFEIKNGGTGYTSAPTITLSSGTATAVAAVFDGVVLGITVTDPGSGYSTPPTVSFSGGGGSGAEAVAYLSEKPIIRDNVVSSGYYKGSDYDLVTVKASGKVDTSGSLTLIDLDYSTIPYPFEVLGVGAYSPITPDANLQVRVYVDGINQQNKYPCTILAGNNSESITRTSSFSNGSAGGNLNVKVYTDNTIVTDCYVMVFVRVLTDSSNALL